MWKESIFEQKIVLSVRQGYLIEKKIIILKGIKIQIIITTTGFCSIVQLYLHYCFAFSLIFLG